MSRALVILNTDEARTTARNWISKAPIGTRVEFKRAKRTVPQNDFMWSLLTEVAEQVEHHGLRYTPDAWKLIFMAAHGQELRTAPSLDGKSLVPLTRSSDLSTDEMTSLIDFILAWGDQNGVVFKLRTPNGIGE